MGILLALVVALAFSVMNLAIRKGGRAYPGEDGVLPSLVVNALGFAVVFSLASINGALLEPRLDATLVFAAAGLTGAFLGRFLLFGGINRIGVVRASALKNATPIVTLLVAVVLIGERFTLLGSTGIALILVAVLAVVRESLRSYRPPPGHPGSGGASSAPDPAALRRERRVLAVGVAFGLLSAVAFGWGNALGKIGVNIVPDPIQGGAFSAWTGLGAYVVAAAVRGGLRPAVRSVLAPRPWFWLAGVGGTVGNLAFFAAVQHAPVGAVTVVAASEVVITMLLGGLLAQQLEQVSRRIAIPAVMVFVGAALIAISR